MTKSTQILSPGQTTISILPGPVEEGESALSLAEFNKAVEVCQNPNASLADVFHFTLAEKRGWNDPAPLHQPKGQQRPRRRQHRQQRRSSSDDEPGESDPPPPPPTCRSFYDSLCGIFQRFPYLLTCRTPRPTSKTYPKHDPQAQQKLERKIALSLAAQGIHTVVCSAFSSINGQSTTPHVHAALSKPPSLAWRRAFAAEFGKRAVDVREIGTSELDPQRVASYISHQTVSLTIATPRPSGKPFVRSAPLDEAQELFSEPEGKGDSVLSSFTLGEVGPIALAMNPPQTIPPDARMRLEALGLLRPRPPPRRSDNDTAAHRPSTITPPIVRQIGNKHDQEETNNEAPQDDAPCGIQRSSIKPT